MIEIDTSDMPDASAPNQPPINLSTDPERMRVSEKQNKPLDEFTKVKLPSEPKPKVFDTTEMIDKSKASLEAKFSEVFDVTEDKGVVKKKLKAADVDSPFVNEKEEVTVNMFLRLEQANFMDPEGILVS